MIFFRCPLSFEVRILRSWEIWIFLPWQNFGKTSPYCHLVSYCPEKFWFKCATCMIDTVHCCYSDVFIVNLGQISHIVLMFPLLILNKKLMPAGKQVTKVNPCIPKKWELKNCKSMNWQREILFPFSDYGFRSKAEM